MQLTTLIQDTDYSVRTQISLSPSLYQFLQKKSREDAKSMAAVIRDTILAYFQEEEKRQQDEREYLKNLAKAGRSIGKKSGWGKVKNPYKLIREWRKADDIHRQSLLLK